MQIPKRYTYPSPSFEHFWANGRGVQLLSTLSTLPDEKAIKSLIPYYYQTDSLADEVVHETFLTIGFEPAHQLLTQAFTPAFPSDQYPKTAQMIREMEVLPNWFNSKFYEAGIQLCQRSGPYGLMVLRNYALMGGYESAAINKPLIYTGALRKGAAKRLRETTEFWIQVVGPSALESKTIQRYALQTRLMHAYSRIQILKQSDWDSAMWGEPLNAWDMVATNLGFSIVFLDGLRAMGFNPTPNEITGLFHFWKYMGFLLGIPVELLPNSELEAVHCLYLWTMNQPGADTDTVALAKALYNEPLASPFPKYRWQKWLVKNMHLGYNAHFLGKTSCTNLGLKFSNYRKLVQFIAYINSKKERKRLRNTIKMQQAILKNRNVQERIVALFYQIKN